MYEFNDACDPREGSRNPGPIVSRDNMQLLINKT